MFDPCGARASSRLGWLPWITNNWEEKPRLIISYPSRRSRSSNKERMSLCSSVDSLSVSTGKILEQYLSVNCPKNLDIFLNNYVHNSFKVPCSMFHKRLPWYALQISIRWKLRWKARWRSALETGEVGCTSINTSRAMPSNFQESSTRRID